MVPTSYSLCVNDLLKCKSWGSQFHSHSWSGSPFSLALYCLQGPTYQGPCFLITYPPAPLYTNIGCLGALGTYQAGACWRDFALAIPSAWATLSTNINMVNSPISLFFFLRGVPWLPYLIMTHAHTSLLHIPSFLTSLHTSDPYLVFFIAHITLQYSIIPIFIFLGLFPLKQNLLKFTYITLDMTVFCSDIFMPRQVLGSLQVYSEFILNKWIDFQFISNYAASH